MNLSEEAGVAFKADEAPSEGLLIFKLLIYRFIF